jgi:hypothetical protein
MPEIETAVKASADALSKRQAVELRNAGAPVNAPDSIPGRAGFAQFSINRFGRYDGTYGYDDAVRLTGDTFKSSVTRRFETSSREYRNYPVPFDASMNQSIDWRYNRFGYFDGVLNSTVPAALDFTHRFQSSDRSADWGYTTIYENKAVLPDVSDAPVGTSHVLRASYNDQGYWDATLEESIARERFISFDLRRSLFVSGDRLIYDGRKDASAISSAIEGGVGRGEQVSTGHQYNPDGTVDVSAEKWRDAGRTWMHNFDSFHSGRRRQVYKYGWSNVSASEPAGLADAALGAKAELDIGTAYDETGMYSGSAVMTRMYETWEEEWWGRAKYVHWTENWENGAVADHEVILTHFAFAAQARDFMKGTYWIDSVYFGDPSRNVRESEVVPVKSGFEVRRVRRRNASWTGPPPPPE